MVVAEAKKADTLLSELQKEKVRIARSVIKQISDFLKQLEYGKQMGQVEETEERKILETFNRGYTGKLKQLRGIVNSQLSIEGVSREKKNRLFAEQALLDQAIREQDPDKFIEDAKSALSHILGK